MATDLTLAPSVAADGSVGPNRWQRLTSTSTDGPAPVMANTVNSRLAAEFAHGDREARFKQALNLGEQINDQLALNTDAKDSITHGVETDGVLLRTGLNGWVVCGQDDPSQWSGADRKTLARRFKNAMNETDVSADHRSNLALLATNRAVRSGEIELDDALAPVHTRRAALLAASENNDSVIDAFSPWTRDPVVVDGALLVDCDYGPDGGAIVVVGHGADMPHWRYGERSRFGMGIWTVDSEGRTPSDSTFCPSDSLAIARQEALNAAADDYLESPFSK
jgi:hypothetical protein